MNDYNKLIRYMSVLFGGIGATTLGAFFMTPTIQGFIGGLMSSLIGMVLSMYTEG